MLFLVFGLSARLCNSPRLFWTGNGAIPIWIGLLKKGKEKMKKYIIALLMCVCMPAYATTVVATVNGKPRTDDDITARTNIIDYKGK